MQQNKDALDGGWGWMIIVGVSIINLTLLPLVQCFGLLFDERFKDMHVSTASTSFLLHLNSSLVCLLALTGGPLLKHISFRQVALIGCVVTATGITLTSVGQTYTHYIITYCVFMGVGQGILFPATTLALNSYFSKKRSTAVGLSITMTGLGPIIAPLVVTKLMEYYGVNGTVLLLGGAAFNSIMGALLLRPLKKEKSILKDIHKNETHQTKDRQSNGIAKINDDENQQTEKTTMLSKNEHTLPVPLAVPDVMDEIQSLNCNNNIFQQSSSNSRSGRIKAIGNSIANSLDLNLLMDPIYINIVLGMGLSFVAELNFNLLTPFILADLADLPKDRVATVMSLQAFVDIAARFIIPPAADYWHWKSRNMYMVSLFLSIVGRTLLAHLSFEYSAVLAIAVILGIGKGMKAVFQALIMPNYAPLERLPGAVGLLMVSNGLMSLILGPLIGLVRDKNTSYVPALYTTSALSLTCIILWIIEIAVKKCKKVPVETETTSL